MIVTYGEHPLPPQGGGLVPDSPLEGVGVIMYIRPLPNNIPHHTRHFQILFTEQVKHFCPLKSRVFRISATALPGNPRKYGYGKVSLPEKFFTWGCVRFHNTFVNGVVKICQFYISWPYFWAFSETPPENDRQYGHVFDRRKWTVSFCIAQFFTHFFLTV